MNPQNKNSVKFSASSKCDVHSCNTAVAGISRHASCNRHRPCNSGGYYNPEKCDICRSMFSKAKSEVDVGRPLILGLFKSMRKSSSFHQPIQWINPEFKKLYYDPLLRSRSSTPTTSRRSPAAHPRSSSVANPASHVSPDSLRPDAPLPPNGPLELLLDLPVPPKPPAPLPWTRCLDPPRTPPPALLKQNSEL